MLYIVLFLQRPPAAYSAVIYVQLYREAAACRLLWIIVSCNENGIRKSTQLVSEYNWPLLMRPMWLFGELDSVVDLPSSDGSNPVDLRVKPGRFTRKTRIYIYMYIYI